jgi:predicted nucleic acid-binding protein
MSVVKPFLDTNILIYAYSATETAKRDTPTGIP